MICLISWSLHFTNFPFKIHQVQYLQEINSLPRKTLMSVYCVCMFTCRYQCYTSYWITWQKCTENVLLSTSQYPQTGRPQQWFCWPIFLGKRGNSILALTYGMWLSQRRKIIFSYRYVFPATLKEKKKSTFFPGKQTKKQRCTSCLSDISCFKNEMEH